MRMVQSSLAKDVCHAIKKLRLEKGISQEELALLSELDRSYFSGIERGLKNITFGTLEKIIPHICDSNTAFFRFLIKELAND